jgi:rubrerythrin
MLAQEPINLGDVSKEDIDKEILRWAMIAELDAINVYEQFAAKTKNKDIKKVFLDVAKEEKTHAGEFETMLLRLDNEQVSENENARKEIEELTGKS